MGHTGEAEWESFIDGNSEQALDFFQQAYRTMQTEGELANVGLALLDLRRYEEALEIFTQVNVLWKNRGIIAENPKIGVAHWLMGNKIAAIQSWEESLHATHTDLSGGVPGLSLKWFAAKQMGNLEMDFKTLSRLKKLWKPRLASSPAWPGPIAIAGFLSDQVDENRFVNEWTIDLEALEIRRKARASFWAGVKRGPGGIASKPEFVSAVRNRRAILEPEFFMARWVLENGG